MGYFLSEDRNKLRYPDYWDRDPNTWGNINDWDVYWAAQPQRVLLNKCNSHSALSEELNILKKILDPTNPLIWQPLVEKVFSAGKNRQKVFSADKDRWCVGMKTLVGTSNDKIWEGMNQISSLKVGSDIVDLKLEIDQKEGRRAVHQITQEGLKVAQKGIQKYSEAEFDTRTKVRPPTPTNRNYQEIQNDDDSYYITNGTDDYLQKAVESMAGQVESVELIVDDVNLEEIFENYRNECKNKFDDIMDLRPASQLTNLVPEVTWEKFISDTYPEYKIPEK
ncbi:6927_t:CDS:2 [Racocetra persica]|uniref:6927_t:CDS:1 n=1 Tax=Racocetra persica TaxID=160502 RepID=A0ACA9MIU8_9GLOM|nr:6927_t:CDS:2 [Racocetra persica]